MSIGLAIVLILVAAVFAFVVGLLLPSLVARRRRRPVVEERPVVTERPLARDRE